MHRKPGIILNPQYGDLKTELSNWFTQEIFYLEKKLHLSILPINGSTEQKSSEPASKKNDKKDKGVLTDKYLNFIPLAQ